MTKLLQKFYDDYHDWLITGAIDDDVNSSTNFHRYTGLCGNLTNWMTKQSIEYPERPNLRRELKYQFLDAKLDPTYPFGGIRVFENEIKNNILHLNPERIQWVEGHISK